MVGCINSEDSLSFPFPSIVRGHCIEITSLTSLFFPSCPNFCFSRTNSGRAVLKYFRMTTSKWLLIRAISSTFSFFKCCSLMAISLAFSFPPHLSLLLRLMERSPSTMYGVNVIFHILVKSTSISESFPLLFWSSISIQFIPMANSQIDIPLTPPKN